MPLRSRKPDIRGRHAAPELAVPEADALAGAALAPSTNGHSSNGAPPKQTGPRGRGKSSEALAPRPQPGTPSGRQLLGEIIVQQRLVTAAALAEVLDEQGAGQSGAL